MQLSRPKKLIAGLAADRLKGERGEEKRRRAGVEGDVVTVVQFSSSPGRERKVWKASSRCAGSLQKVSLAGWAGNLVKDSAAARSTSAKEFALILCEGRAWQSCDRRIRINYWP